MVVEGEYIGGKVQRFESSFLSQQVQQRTASDSKAVAELRLVGDQRGTGRHLATGGTSGGLARSIHYTEQEAQRRPQSMEPCGVLHRKGLRCATATCRQTRPLHSEVLLVEELLQLQQHVLDQRLPCSQICVSY